MADNTQLGTPSGVGDLIASDDIGGVKHQRVKVEYGADGSATDVSTTNPLPVTLANTGANATAVKVDGSAVTQPVSDGGGNLSIDDGGNSITVDGTVAISGTVAVTDNSGSLTVDGTVTAQTGQSLDYDTGAGTQTTQIVGIALPASGGPVAGGTSTNPLQVSLANTGANTNKLLVTPDLPSGAATSAKQDTQITSLQLIDDPIATIGSTPLMRVAIFDNADTQVTSFGGGSGTQYTEDAASAANPVGTVPMLVRQDSPTSEVSANGDNIAARGSAYGAQYVTLLDTGGSPVSVGGGTQYTEDAAAAANPIGTVPILVRKDTPSSEVSADGDNIAARGTAYGAQYVTLLDTGGSPVSVGGGTQYTEDAAAASDPIGNALIMVRKDTLAALTSADGDNVAARGTDKGELYVKHADAIPVTDNGGSLTVDGTVTANLASGTNNIGDVDVLTVPADPFGANADAASATGSISAKLRFIASTGIPVTGTVTVGSHAVTNAGTFAVQESGTHVQVDDAAFTPATSKVVMFGAQLDDSSPDSVDEGDGGAVRMSANRNLYVRIRDNAGNERGLNIDANGELQISGSRNAIAVTDNSGSLTVDGTVTANLAPTTSGGLTIATGSIAATKTSIKGSAGQVYGWYIYNPNASVAYVQFFNAATGSVTLGTTAPDVSIGIPATSAANVEFSMGIPFSSQISIAITTTRAGSTGPGSTVDYNILYK